MAKYKRILLKLSGESLMGEKQYGIDEKRLAEYAEQIKEILLQNLYSTKLKNLDEMDNFLESEMDNFQDR